MSVLYLAGSGPGAGATAVAAGLAAAWRSANGRVPLVKPLSPPDDPDPSFFARLGGSPDTVTVDGAPSPADLDAAARIVQWLSASPGTVIVEGLPFTNGEDAGRASAELAERVGGRVVGVLAYDRSLGGETGGAWRSAYGPALAGCLVNKRTRYAEHDAASRLVPELAGDGLRAFGVLPEERLLLAPTIQQVVDLLGGVYFSGADGGALIEHFLIGGLIMEWGGNYFGRRPNQAVLVRGGRIDIQMAALNFPLNALVLTGCEEPSQYVYQRAIELDVPLIAVRQDTHEAAAALESLSAASGAHHPAKAERAAQLLDAHADLAAMRSAVGVE